MIDNICFTKEWISRKAREIGRADPVLLEKTILAFTILSGLSRSQIPFVFKGGTSLILLLKDFRRLSIDVDIVTDVPRAEYEPVLAEIGKSAPFKTYAEDKRGHRGLPKRSHFKFFYNSAVTGRRDYVLLDILEDRDFYPETQVVPIRASILELEKESKVRVPVLECLLGDKLTAFAPNTIGVPYRPLLSMQIIKQLFDIGELFGVVEDLGLVMRSYEAIAQAEIGYRENKFTYSESVEDTLQSAIKACSLGVRGFKRDARSEFLMEGIKKIGTHMVQGRFNVNDAQVTASRVALLAALVKSGEGKRNLRDLRWKPENIVRLDSISLIGPLERFNRVKATLPEAFYNLHMAQSLLGVKGNAGL